MFSGIVERMGTVRRLIADPPGVRLVIESPEIARDTKIGDSIAVNGCCLTVVEVDERTFGFDAGAETLSRTNLGQLREGSRVNLERSLKVGGELGGHFVSGHIDAVGWLDQRLDDKDWSTFWFRMPRPADPADGQQGLDRRRRRQPDAGGRGRRTVQRGLDSPHAARSRPWAGCGPAIR